MSEIWYEEELFPSDDWLEQAHNTKSPFDPQEPPRGNIRVHTPIERVIGTSEKLSFRRPEHIYVFVKLGCEFDPGEAARAAKFGYVSAIFKVHCEGEGELQPRVQDIFPEVINKGKPDNVKLKFEPAITFVSGTGGSLGGIERDYAVGQVAPVVTGFKGGEEHAPYWNLEHHREAPLYGLRNFWILLEIPPKLSVCHLIPYADGTMQARFGPIPLKPKVQQTAHRPRYTIRL